MNNRFDAKYSNGGTSIDIHLAVYTFVDGGASIAYCPALDLSGYGETEEQAKSSFEEVMKQYIKYGISHGTLFRDMKKYGWNIANNKASSPLTIKMIKKNDILRDIVENKDYCKYSESISIPIMA